MRPRGRLLKVEVAALLVLPEVAVADPRANVEEEELRCDKTAQHSVHCRT